MLRSKLSLRNFSFVIFVLGIIYQLFHFSSPFIDEALYINAGKRIQNGMYLYDGYSSWFNGSPFIWPLLSSIIHEYLGLVGSRLFSSAFTFITLIYFWKLTNKLFNKSIADWSLLLLCSNFYVVSFAFIAVYDSMALCFFIMGFYYFQFETAKSKKLSAFLISISIFVKYAFLGMIPILIMHTLVTKRYKHFWKTLLYIGWLTLPYFYFIRGGFLSSYGAADWSPDRFAILIMLANFLKDSLILCSFGLVLIFIKKENKRYGVFFILSLIMWPTFHILFQNNTSAHKHIVYGFFISFPLIGILFDKLALKKKVLAFSLFVLTFLYQISLFKNSDYIWPNFNTGFEYLNENYQNGEVIFSTKPEHVQYHLKLYKHKSCDLILNDWCIEQTQMKVCNTNWVVINRYKWDKQQVLVDEIINCGFTLESKTSSKLKVVKDIFSFIEVNHQLEIYKKTK